MNALINALCAQVLAQILTLGAQFLTLGAQALAGDHAILRLKDAIDARNLAVSDTNLVGTVIANSLALDALGPNRTFCANLTFCTNLLALGANLTFCTKLRAFGASRAVGRTNLGALSALSANLLALDPLG